MASRPSPTQPLDALELETLDLWLAHNPDKGLPALAVRRLVATIRAKQLDADVAYAILAADLTPDSEAR